MTDNVIPFPIDLGIGRDEHRWDDLYRGGYEWADALLDDDPTLTGADIYERWKYQTYGPAALDPKIVLPVSTGIAARIMAGGAA